MKETLKMKQRKTHEMRHIARCIATFCLCTVAFAFAGKPSAEAEGVASVGAQPSVRLQENRTVSVQASKKPTYDEEISLRAQCLLKACDQVRTVFTRQGQSIEISDVLSLATVTGGRWDRQSRKYIADVRINGVVRVQPLPSLGGSDSGAQPASGPKYTGVIIDCRGLGMQRCMSPKIIRDDGSEVWGTFEQVNLDYVVETGIALWARSEKELALEEVRKRIGANPLLLTAIDVDGHSGSVAVLSDEDATRLLEEDKRGNFLSRFAVVFLYGQNED
jgi:hypothetical protein